MSVVRVIGNVDGIEIVFGRTEAGHWVSSVPYDLDGEYVIEVTAIDEAGNEAYSAEMLFIVDLKTLKTELKPLNFTTIIYRDNSEELSDVYKFIKLEENYTYRILPIKSISGGGL